MIGCRLILAILILSVSSCKQNFKQHHWKLQSQASKTSVDYKELVKMANNIKVMSQNRLVIDVYPNGELIGGAGIFNSVKRGEIQMGNGWPNWWSSQHPAWALMNAGPFDFMNLDSSMMFFLAGEGTNIANELSSKKGVIWRPAWWPGMEFGLLSKTPVSGLKDLKDKKIRIGPGLPSEVLAKASGAYSIPLVPSEIRKALESDELDAVEWTTASGVLDLGLSDIAPHAIIPAVWQPSVLSDFLISKQAYDGLSPDLQLILETAIKSYTLTTTMKAKLQDIHSLEQLKQDGVKISKWSKDDIGKWKVATDQVMNEYASKDEFFKRVIEKKKEFKKRYRSYYKFFGAYDKD
jgi:TRAP-type mannitol/chloroaromatic compound transport system substrate-binding protein